MTIHLSSDWEHILSQKAAAEGTTPEELVLAALQEKFAVEQVTVRPADSAWEELVRGIGQDCGASLSHEAVSSEGLYD